MRRFIFPLILTTIFLYLFFRFIFGFLEAPLYGILPLFFFFGSFASFVWLVFFHWNADHTHISKWHKFFERTAHLSMGFLSFLFVYVVFRDLLLIAGLSALQSPQANFGLFLVTVLSGVAGFLIAVEGPIVKTVHIQPNYPLPLDFKLRIVQLSDLHVGSWIGRKYVRGVVDQVLAIGEIDLLLLTGDIGDGDPKLYAAELEAIAEINPRLGKFSVSGNHEGYWDVIAWNRVLEDFGFRVLENAQVSLMAGSVAVKICGISDLEPDLKTSVHDVDATTLNFLLAHQPHHADAVSRLPGSPIHLQLSGHTHNGQYIPWSWLIRIFQKYPAGLYHLGKMLLYVNVGTGFWGAPLRLGTRSEITVMEIRALS